MNTSMIKYVILIIFIAMIVFCSCKSCTFKNQESMVNLSKLNEKFKSQIEKMKGDIETIQSVHNIIKSEN
jgi:peptidoglycan hydrolase CwlO-like protein